MRSPTYPPPPSTGPVETEGALRMRRALLLEGLAASLRLPETPVVVPPTPGAAPGAGGEAGDGVFLRLMSLTKGKKLLARAVRVVYPAPEAAAPRHSALVAGGDVPATPPAHPANLRVVWAALRNLRVLFGGQVGTPEELSACAVVASATAKVLRRLHSPRAVADCLAAVLAGDLDGAPLLDMQPDAVLMPLYAPGGCGRVGRLGEATVGCGGKKGCCFAATALPAPAPGTLFACKPAAHLRQPSSHPASPPATPRPQAAPRMTPSAPGWPTSSWRCCSAPQNSTSCPPR